MAGSVTATTSTVENSGGVTKYSLAWTSDAAGAVSGTTTAMSPGTVLAVTFAPGAGGSQPTDLYDVTMLCSAHSIDVFGGEGANRSNATSSHTVPFISNSAGSSFVRQWLHGGNYELTVAAAGNAKSGTVDIYVASGVV